MGSVLDMLNIINGILFVQISQQDIENFKMEFEKRQSHKQVKQLFGIAEMSMKCLKNPGVPISLSYQLCIELTSSP